MKYDLLQYSRDNLIATSGTIGDWIDLAHIPVALGTEMPERVMKWLAYKKLGIAMYDSSQEGAQVINTTFNGFDDTVKAQSIEAIQLAINSVEAQASAMTGVFAEKLGQIEQHDAVSNVKVGIHQSTLLTKQYFHAMDLMYKEVNYDLLNLAKVVYKDGFTGTIVLGNRLTKTFTALPEHYTMTDYDLHLEDSAESFELMKQAQALNVEMIKGGLVDAQDAFAILASKNVTQLKRYMNKSIATKKLENNTIEQLKQQVDESNKAIKQYEQQVEQLNSQLQSLQKQLESNNQQKLRIEQQRVNIENKVANDKKEYNDKMIDTKNKQLELEYLQTRDGNPYNDEIRNI